MMEPVIEPVYLGPASEKIFGVFHPAHSAEDHTLTLICPPLFSDYMRTHFALRQLAIKLAAKGHNVLRIDFRGTGDSFGSLCDVTPSDWVDDITLSLREGLDLSGSTTVRVIAVRAGALLAAKALAGRSNIDRFVFWDPVVDGHTLLAELRRIQNTMLSRTIVSRADRLVAQHEFAGYRLSKSMVEQIEGLTSDTYASLPRDRTFVVETVNARCSTLAARERHTVTHNCDWTTESEDQLLSAPVLERLAECSTKP